MHILIPIAVPTGLYFTLAGTMHLPGDTVLVTDIGGFASSSDPGRSLVCVTSNVNTQCCRGSDGGNVGEWHFPNGDIVVRNNNADFFRSAFTHQVRLNRGNNNTMGPTGAYECRVPDGVTGDVVTASIILTTGKYVQTINHLA